MSRHLTKEERDLLTAVVVKATLLGFIEPNRKPSAAVTALKLGEWAYAQAVEGYTTRWHQRMREDRPCRVR